MCINWEVVCGTNTGELTLFESANSFKSKKHNLGSFSIRKLSVSSSHVVVLTNNNHIKMYSNNNYTMAMSSEDLSAEPITDILCLESGANTQVIWRP